ncbi:MAG: Ni/Fe hydrogenase subunit alpha [Candidatus Hydrogenedentes bacterium]|nr:Ni/Fe hydrogenase subunit alpha [Candidatus Hydrogenedentota bacterium]
MCASKNSRTLKVDYMARVEGEGALLIKIKNGAVKEVKLNIFEPPRFFEAFLRGRKWTEAPDITARICGICPVAYQSSSISAMESIAGIRIDGPLRELRRLIYCGEWIESHVLHLAMLHAPDFLGYQDAIAMAKDYPAVVQDALRLKKLGNDIMKVLGGREIHPISMRVGGFYKVPEPSALQQLVPELEWGLEAAEGLARLVATFDFPEFTRDYTYVCMRHPGEYPLCEGRLVSNRGMDIALDAFYEHIEEEHMEHSTSLHSVIKGEGDYHVGPLARFNLNFDRLTPRCQALAEELGAAPPCNNPFKSIIVRAIETLWACEEALRLIQGYVMPDAPSLPAEPRAGRGHGCSEAPRGICYHTYVIDEEGIIQEARIAPPTAQNQRTMERDLRELVPGLLGLSNEELTWKCEQAVRNYDPCISCSCHFLRLEIDRDA